MIRFILVCIVVIGYLILSIPILLVEWIIGRFSPEKKDISSLRIIQAVFRFILKITGAKITVIGEENVPKDTPVLYIGNHRSYFDILLTYSRCPIRTGYIAKKEMEKIPLLSTWMRYLHCLFLDRKDIKQGLKTILTAVDKVKSGISICIFPEGTRNRNKDELDMLPFHEGSFKIATKANCPIIPIAISNSANIFEAHFPKISPAKVVVEYGKPIYPDELSKEDKRHVGEYTQNVIREMLIKNKPLTDYINQRVEEIDQIHQLKLEKLSVLAENHATPEQMEKVASNISLWGEIDFEEKRFTVDKMIRSLKVFPGSVQIQWKF